MKKRLITLVYTNFGVKDLRPGVGVLKGAEPEYDISFVSLHQVYELLHIRVLVKLITVDLFKNIEKKNESSVNNFLFKSQWKTI